MGWGSRPSFNIRGDLSFARCEKDFIANKFGVWNISTAKDNRTNYIVRKIGREAYALKMYNTDIITWYRNGDIEYRDYDSTITREVMNEFGPLRVWKDPHTKYHHKFRWGRAKNYYSQEPEVSLPFCQKYDTMRLPADGMIEGLFDLYDRVDPKRRGERTKMLKTYRAHALPRILLGEFGVRFAVHGTSTTKGFGRKQNVTGWWAHIPREYTHLNLFRLFSANADHDEIETEMNRCPNWELTSPSESRETATRKAIDIIGRSALNHREWYEEIRVEHEPVNWQEFI
jgi:hypothetical protein